MNHDVVQRRRGYVYDKHGRSSRGEVRDNYDQIYFLKCEIINEQKIIFHSKTQKNITHFPHPSHKSKSLINLENSIHLHLASKELLYEINAESAVVSTCL